MFIVKSTLQHLTSQSFKEKLKNGILWKRDGYMLLKMMKN